LFLTPDRLTRASLTPAVAALRPSEYTAALIYAIQRDPELVRGKHVLELGSGSGVVLAAAAQLGASHVCGVDIEEDAVLASQRLLTDLGHGDKAEFHVGDLWQPLGSRRFDTILANLPHFPMNDGTVPGRRSTWSVGGPDGRRLLDRFIDELPQRLQPGGRAIITHNGFVDTALSRLLLASHGLKLAVLHSILVPLAEEKMARVSKALIESETNRSLHQYGPYSFGEVHIVEIS
jgi:release factor glutamine methyltransferase